MAWLSGWGVKFFSVPCKGVVITRIGDYTNTRSVYFRCREKGCIRV
ncbi:hypothetical protein HMPREF1250_2116 [Megasphaera vaginalis (ex Srinivasan et al. 2021)]|uniref:Uncharacterized protein n=1 Tax=Megasphaera vaginalis (ex Srinivasan et al. 2021) TaxID=1111454 RepID=U7UQK3_9FIRM|nr:hypothetical protein HMPREF1250_2116 [Megasphaera vaginalis (ex Srinivasan et al. 2021)]